MKYSLAILAAAVSVYAIPFPQAVTDSIAPEAPAPSGCSTDYDGTFGVAVMNITDAGSAAVTTLPDGQPGASTGAAPITTIADGQPQASTGGAAPISTIGDGQPQAPTGAPISTIADGQPQAPTGAPAVSTIADGQPQAPTGTAISTIADGQPQAPVMTMAPINQIGDGQIQNQQTVTPINQISDGQIQQSTAAAISTIGDGQPQAPTGGPAVSTIADGQPQAPTGAPVSTIADGQPQAPTGAPISTIADGQPQAPTGAPVSTIGDGQPQAPTGTAVNTISDGQPQATPAPSASGSAAPQMVACQNDDSLQVTLSGGVLTDNVGRIGYIASNYQFQFDGPPQAGAIYTAGWSVCGNGSLALGGSSVFYQCLSGDFYNLYDRNWAAQCNPITINVVDLIDCAT